VATAFLDGNDRPQMGTSARGRSTNDGNVGGALGSPGRRLDVWTSLIVQVADALGAQGLLLLLLLLLLASLMVGFRERVGWGVYLESEYSAFPMLAPLAR